MGADEEDKDREDKCGNGVPAGAHSALPAGAALLLKVGLDGVMIPPGNGCTCIVVKASGALVDGLMAEVLACANAYLKRAFGATPPVYGKAEMVIVSAEVLDGMLPTSGSLQEEWRAYLLETQVSRVERQCGEAGEQADASVVADA